MDNGLVLWIVILASGALTFGLRWSFIHALGGREIPPTLMRLLRFVPPAVLAALVVPAILRPDGPIDFSLDNHRLIAGAFALVAAAVTRSVFGTLAVGMGVLWIVNYLFP